jgi:PAS domain S-box-containing protein
MILPGNNLPSSLLSRETLMKNFEKLGTIFNSMREIIFTIDIEKGVIENVNNSVEVLGYIKSEWEGQQYANWPIKQRKKFFHLLKHASNSLEQATSIEINLLTKDGTKEIPFEFSTALFIYEEKRYLLCVLRDFTDREKLLQSLRKALAKEKSLNELRSMFVSTASHQFRTPLTIIQSGIEIMEMYLEDLPIEKSKPFHRQFNRIQGEIERLQSLMNDVLLLGRADAQRTPFKPKKGSIIQFCAGLAEKYNNRHSENRKVEFTITGNPQEISFDSKLLDHALENILSNAYKYSTEGCIVMNIHFNNDAVSLSVSDKGIGIPKNEIANLFEPFFRSSNADEINGTGLGLAIAKEFIDIHEGDISVRSELNVGTTITISLPLAHKNA